VPRADPLLPFNNNNNSFSSSLLPLLVPTWLVDLLILTDDLRRSIETVADDQLRLVDPFTLIYLANEFVLF
jgi:hypothetical protein